MGEVIAEVTPVARKDHSCWWCGETINKGDRYSGWTWVDGGSAMRIRVHPECGAAWRTIDDPEDIPEAMFSRGCHCDHGNCKCEKSGPNSRGGSKG